MDVHLSPEISRNQWLYLYTRQNSDSTLLIKENWNKPKYIPTFQVLFISVEDKMILNHIFHSAQGDNLLSVALLEK